MSPEGSIYEGKTLDDAVRKGLEKLGLTRAEAMITVIEEGSRGFLGLGSRPFRVRIQARPGGAIREPEDRDERRRGGRDRDRGRDRERGGRDRDRGGRRGSRDERRPGGRDERRGAGRDERPSAGREERPEGAREERRSGGRDDRPEGQREERRGGRDRDERRGGRDRDERRGGGRDERRGPGREGGRDERREREPRPEREGRPEREPRPEREGRPEREPRPEREGRPDREPRPMREPRPEAPAAVEPMTGAPMAGMGAAGEGAGEAGERRRRRRGRRGGRGRRREGAPGVPGAPTEGAPHEAFVDEGHEPEAFAHDADEQEYTDVPVGAAEPADMGDFEEVQVAYEDTPDESDAGETAAAEASYDEAPRPARREAPRGPSLSNDALAAEGKRVTEELLKAMGFDATVTATAEHDRVDVIATVSADDDLLTGRKGETRQALQHLLNRMVNRGGGSQYHLQLEINDFWKHREEELAALARSLAEEALAKNGEAVSEYLNSQERRIVHVTLREDTRVKTYALGTGLIKRLAVAPADFPEGPRDED